MRFRGHMDPQTEEIYIRSHFHQFSIKPRRVSFTNDLFNVEIKKGAYYDVWENYWNVTRRPRCSAAPRTPTGRLEWISGSASKV
jgi:hypothetical protein